ncbi:hypothetical protein [Saccharopolyspora phatthalungensis]|uniref:Uncharacterized protein n=1 Tax=Saccharopolyspora phatthalungensis TaxID=664693 RepID=A0A840QD52_9PSEU|nr:hypothetical protein [Saccharopolyspora phatthalungensis]MBB5157917.1 hypothetical protein [Saccharopolyspora phatthalungensis]
MFQPQHHCQPAEHQRHPVGGIPPQGRPESESIDTRHRRTASAVERTDLSKPRPTCLDFLPVGRLLNRIAS